MKNFTTFKETKHFVTGPLALVKQLGAKPTKIVH